MSLNHGDCEENIELVKLLRNSWLFIPPRIMRDCTEQLTNTIKRESNCFRQILIRLYLTSIWRVCHMDKRSACYFSSPLNNACGRGLWGGNHSFPLMSDTKAVRSGGSATPLSDKRLPSDLQLNWRLLFVCRFAEANPPGGTWVARQWHRWQHCFKSRLKASPLGNDKERLSCPRAHACPSLQTASFNTPSSSSNTAISPSAHYLSQYVHKDVIVFSMILGRPWRQELRSKRTYFLCCSISPSAHCYDISNSSFAHNCNHRIKRGIKLSQFYISLSSSTGEPWDNRILYKRVLPWEVER